jgi:DNA-binding MurR/RpiR family transcriptional regulator
MVQGKIIRVIGAGRARLAAAIPANRLAHGGAQVYVQDDIVPMPHTIRGGGIIAASASGRTESVLAVLRSTRQYSRDVEVLGIAASSATEFASLCDIFIGIVPSPPHLNNPLHVLADAEEYIISGLLDGLVVSAGKLGGFDDAYWRLGHEDLGATGPYNFSQQSHDPHLG